MTVLAAGQLWHYGNDDCERLYRNQHDEPPCPSCGWPTDSNAHETQCGGTS